MQQQAVGQRSGESDVGIFRKPARLGHMDAPDSDEALMCRYRDGDAAAFETLYQRHRGGLFRFILRQCESNAVAEELFQDVWMRLIKARTRYEATAKFTTYLYQMARNRVIDHYRRQSTKGLAASTSLINPEELVDTKARQPDAMAITEQDMTALLALVQSLPEEQRTAFLLREEAGMSIQQIAECTSVNAETAKSRLRYAVRKLREGLGEHHE